MDRKTRLILAIIITLILAVAGTTVWAGSNYKNGSLGRKVHEMSGKCNGATINMGDATFTMTVGTKIICNYTVTRTKIPNSIMGAAPEGKEYRSDGFIVSGGPSSGLATLTVCFAYSPKDQEKHAQIYVASGPQTGILPAGKAGTPAMLCTTTNVINGTFALIGDAPEK